MKKIIVSLNEKTIESAKAIAEFEQLPYTAMFRNWITQRIRNYDFAEISSKTTAGQGAQKR